MKILKEQQVVQKKNYTDPTRHRKIERRNAE